MPTRWIVFCWLCLGVTAQAASLVETIPLPGVEGIIDHMGWDDAGKRLFVAAKGNNSVEVVDIKAKNVIHSFSGLSEPQGAFYVPGVERLFVSNAGDGTCQVYDGKTFRLLAALSLGEDADNIRFDKESKKVLVGYGSGALALIDPASLKIETTYKLSHHPESFQLDVSDDRIFINIPSSHQIAVLKKSTGEGVKSWSTGPAAANFSMALDEAHHRLFVGCRLPAKLLIFDTKSGATVQTCDLHGHCDDLIYDAKRNQLYASCGAGTLDVFSQLDPDHYSLKESVQTSPGAKTCYFDENQLYVAVPHHGAQNAEIRVYTP